MENPAEWSTCRLDHHRFRPRPVWRWERAASLVDPGLDDATLDEEKMGMIPATLAADESPLAPLRPAKIPTQPDAVRA
jgi:hypothetical protein